MTLKIDGFDDIFSTVEALGDIGKRASKKAVTSGLETALEQLQKDAPRDSGDGADSLSVLHVRTNNHGSAWGACGIGSQNWSETEHLWYQNYGFENWGLNFKGQPVSANVGWMDKAFKNIESTGKAEKNMLKVLVTEIDKVLK